MAILFCGGEDIDFSPIPKASTDSRAFRSGYGRCGLYGGYACLAPLAQAITSAWFCCRLRLHTVYSNANFIGLVDSAGSGITVSRIDDSNGYLNLIKDGTIIATSGTGLTPSEGLYRVDVCITNYGSASANVKVYWQSTLVIDYTGDITIAGVSELTHVQIKGDSSYASNGGLSEIIVATEDTRLMSLVTLVPEAAGDVNEWEGAYTAIDEVTVSDADAVYTDQDASDFMCQLTGLPAGDFVIRALAVSARAADGVGVMGISLGFNDGVQTIVGDEHVLDASWQSLQDLWHTNPNTTDRFTPTEVESIQLVARSSVSGTTTTTTTA